MGEYASRGSTYAGPVSTSAGYSAPQPAQTPVDRARDVASSAKRQLTLVEAAITELTAAHEANNLPRWKHARARLDVALAQADRRLDQLRSRANNEAETIAALESATRDLATETERAHVAEPPKGYVVVEHEHELVASLRDDASLDSVRTLLDGLAIADLRILRARIASPQSQDALATEIWQLGAKRRQEVSDFIHNVDRRKARERVARPHVETAAPVVETLDTKLSAALEGSNAEVEVLGVIDGLDGADRRSLAGRLRNYRPGSGDGVGARFVRLESALRTQVFAELAKEKPAPRVAVVRPITTANAVVSDRAHDFVNTNRRPLLNAIADRILELGVPRPHPRLHWVSFEEGARAIANEIRNYIEAAPDAALARIARLITTSDLEGDVTKTLDAHGDLPRVALVVARSFDAPVAESVERMGTRLRAQMDAHHKLPDPSTLVASNELDRAVADAMRGRVDGEALAHGAKPEQHGRSLVDGAREVEYEWLGKTKGAQLWNWIRVKSPHDATAEDVATTPLAGGNSTGTEQAYRIAANPPYFGIPFETARLISDAFDYAPAAVKAELAHGPGPRVADADMLARTVVGDEVAIAHAPKATHGDLAPEHSLARLELELDTLQNALEPWQVTRPLEAARAFVARRRQDAPAHVAQWTTVLAAQERVVHAVATETGALTAKPPKGTATDRPIAAVLMAFARAVEVSSLATHATPALAEARHQLAMLPLAQLDLQLEENRKANPQQDPAQALELAKHAADLRAHIERGEIRDPKVVETFAVESGEIALRGQLGSLAAGLKELDNEADEAGIPTSAYSGGLPTLHAMSSVLLKRIGTWTAELDRATHFSGPKPGESAEQTLLEQRRAAITAVSTAVAATQKELQVDKYIAWAQQSISNAMLVKRIVSLVVRVAAEIALMILTGQLAEAGVAAVRGVMLGAEIIGEVREASFAFKIAKSIVAGGLNTVGGAALGGDISMKAFIENAVAMGTMTTIMEPFEGLIAESATLENELRTLGQRAVRTGTEFAIEASAGYVGSFVGHAAVNGATIATPASGEVLEQAFTLLVGKFVHQRTLKMSERLNVAATRLGQDAVAGLRARVAQLTERTAKSHGDRGEALAELRERHQLLLEERALYKGHPELEKLAHEEPTLGGKFADAPLVLSHLEPVVEGHAYLGTREQIDDAVAALESSGLEPKRLAEQTAGTHRYQVGDRVIELRESGHARTAKSEHLTRDDLKLVAKLNELSRELEHARADAAKAHGRAEELVRKIAAVEHQLGLDGEGADVAARRRAVEVHREILADAPRREQARRELGGTHGHPGIELHSHFMGIVEPEVFRQRAATVGGARDTGSWQPLLERIASLPEAEIAANKAAGKPQEPSAFQHDKNHNTIAHRAKAGDAIEIVTRARDQLKVVISRSTSAENTSDAAAFLRGAEVLAEEACRTALTSTPETPFDGAYVIVDALVKTTFGGPAAAGETTQVAEQRAFDDYIREAVLRLAETGTAYSEQSTGVNKLDANVHPDRVAAVVDQLVKEGRIQRGQVDIKMLGMVKTRHYGEREPGMPAVEGSGTRSTSDHAKQNEKALRQTDHPGNVGRDIGGPEAYTFDAAGRDLYISDYRAMVAKAKATGHAQVDRPHVGEGSVDTEAGKPFNTDKDRVLHDDVPAHYQRSRENLEMLLKAAEQLRSEGVWDPTKVITRYGHATHATPQQVARMHALGIVAEVNLGSNVVTGSLSQTQGAHGPRATEPRYQDHSLASLIYYDAQIVLSTDGPGVMATTLATEYARAGQIIEAVLAGEQPIRIAVSDAAVDGRIRGTEVPGQPDQRSLLVDDLTSTERTRFLHAYEKLFADAERYYLRRPKPGARVGGAPLDGAHHTTIAREGGLSSVAGEALFAGTRHQVIDTAAAYRRAGYQVTGDNANALEELVVVVTTPHSNEFTTTLMESDNSQQPSYTRGDRR